MGREDRVGLSTVMPTLLECGQRLLSHGGQHVSGGVLHQHREILRPAGVCGLRDGFSPLSREPESPRLQPRRLSIRLVFTLIIFLIFLLALPRGLATALDATPAQAQAHADKAVQLLREGKLRGAEAELRLAIEMDS